MDSLNTTGYNSFSYQCQESCVSPPPIPSFSESFNQPTSSNPLWGGISQADICMHEAAPPFPDVSHDQISSNIARPEEDFLSEIIFNPTSLLANHQLIGHIPCNINSEFFNHPPEDLIMSTDSISSLYSYPEESILPPGSSDSYLPVDEEVESSDSDEGPIADGGYDYEFARSKEIEEDDLVCPICKLVSREPQQSECCGKVFCKVCVDKLKQSKSFNPKCPNCREQPVSLFADKRSSRSISNLMVFCRRKHKGCKWLGTLQEAGKHLENCNHQRVSCQNECGKRPQRRHMEKHMKKFCVNRVFQCEDCKELGQWAYITGEHIEQCPEKVVECINEGCEYRFNRRSLEEHLLDCPKKLLHCGYSDIGCTVTCKREELSNHEKEHMPSHLQCAVKVARAFVAPHRDHLLQVAPTVVRIPNFSQSNEVRSYPFLTSLKGYKMCLLIRNAVKLEFRFCLMPGLYDCSLAWPFNGKVTLVLLNQKEDRHHHEMSVTLSNEVSVPRVVSRHCDFGQTVLVSKFEWSKPCDDSTASIWQMCLDLEKLGYLLDDIMSVRVLYEPLKRKVHSSLPGRKKVKLNNKHL